MSRKRRRVAIVTLLDERSPSWNLFYGGVNHHKRTAEVNRIHDLVVIECLRMGLAPFTKPVEILVIGYFKGNTQDCDNVCDKPYIDGLKAAGIIADDNIHYVVEAATRSRRGKANSVVIRITEAKPEDYQ